MWNDYLSLVQENCPTIDGSEPQAANMRGEIYATLCCRKRDAASTVADSIGRNARFIGWHKGLVSVLGRFSY